VRTGRSTNTLTAEKKRALLGELLRTGRRPNTFPLSFAQERLWFLHHLTPDGELYNLPKAVELSGPLQVAALEQALGEIMRRHEILRTTYLLVEGRPAQIVAQQGTFSLHLKDLTELPEEIRREETGSLARAESSRPFDLSAGPVLRTMLLQTGSGVHALVLTLHHIAGDGLSLNLLVYEVAMLYQSFAKGVPSSFPELPIQYADFAIWQRERLKGVAFDG
jgi:hypothetical protein